MAIIMRLGFEEFGATAELNSFFDARGGAWTWSASGGRFGGAALTANGTGSDTLRKILGATPTTAIGSVSWRYDPSSESKPLLTFEDSALGAQIQVKVNSANKLELYRGAGATLLATGITTFDRTAWHRLEVKATISDTAGSVEVRQDGVTEITFSGDTQNTANTEIATVRLNADAEGGSPNLWIDDLVVQDTTGPVPGNDFLGDVRLYVDLPDADSTPLQWTALGGGSHFAEVDDPGAHDGDSSFIAGTLSGDEDRFAFPALSPDIVGIIEVAFPVWHRKDDAGAIQWKPRVASGASSADGAVVTPSTSYLLEIQGFPTDPATGSAWIKSAAENVELGVVVV